MKDKFSQKKRSVRQLHARDLERINAAESSLNREALDVLDYQAWPSIRTSFRAPLKSDSESEQ
jgi:hypothetical protein